MTPRTNAISDFLLPVSVPTVPGYAELLFWKHEGDMVTIIVSRRYFPEKKAEKKKRDRVPSYEGYRNSCHKEAWYIQLTLKIF